MNTLKAIAISFLLTVCAFAQTNSITQTTLSTAVVVTDRTITVASATNIIAPAFGTSTGSELYVVAPGNSRGEVMLVQSVSGTVINVARGRQGAKTAFPSGSIVMVGYPNWFFDYDPSGGCTASVTYVTPWVNTKTGAQWLCSTISNSWVAGWGGTNSSMDIGVTTAVASAAGAILPSGPLFHVTGTSAITGFTLPVGFANGQFTIIPDAIFTTTTAGNIALASTAVVNKALTFTYDGTNSKWVPSY